MRDAMSLLLAAAILSIGGLGLYMYKSDEDQEGGDQEGEDKEKDQYYNEDSIFGLDEQSEIDEDDYDYEVYRPKNKKRNIKTKTKRNKKGSGTKRRY